MFALMFYLHMDLHSGTEGVVFIGNNVSFDNLIVKLEYNFLSFQIKIVNKQIIIFKRFHSNSYLAVRTMFYAYQMDRTIVVLTFI